MNTLLVERRGSTSIITLNRPSKKNALNNEMVKELASVVADHRRDKKIKVVIITGGEMIFGAGADLNEITAQQNVFAGYAFSKEIHELFLSIETLSKPVIAAIAGFALGGCFELALACDIRIASQDAKLGLPEINVGLLPGGGGTQRLPRLVGTGRAKWMLFSGKPIDANEAYRIGLVQQIVPQGKLLDKAFEVAEEIADKPAMALATIKDLVATGIELDIAKALQYEARGFGMLFDTEDYLEGVRAFVEKRSPNFNHR